jgi:hypothetical protein
LVNLVYLTRLIHSTVESQTGLNRFELWFRGVDGRVYKKYSVFNGQLSSKKARFFAIWSKNELNCSGLSFCVFDSGIFQKYTLWDSRIVKIIPITQAISVIIKITKIRR